MDRRAEKSMPCRTVVGASVQPWIGVSDSAAVVLSIRGVVSAPRGLDQLCRDCWEAPAVGGAAAGQLKAERSDFGPRVGQFAALQAVGLVDAEVPEVLVDQEGSDVGRT